jgi:hypothetical protein
MSSSEMLANLPELSAPGNVATCGAIDCQLRRKTSPINRRLFHFSFSDFRVSAFLNGPLRYRVRHRAKLWGKEETPMLIQQIIEGNADLSV